MLVADASANRIVRIDRTTHRLSTVAGAYHESGLFAKARQPYATGDGVLRRLGIVAGIEVGPDGTVPALRRIRRR